MLRAQDAQEQRLGRSPNAGGCSVARHVCNACARVGTSYEQRMRVAHERGLQGLGLQTTQKTTSLPCANYCGF